MEPSLAESLAQTMVVLMVSKTDLMMDHAMECLTDRHLEVPTELHLAQCLASTMEVS